MDPDRFVQAVVDSVSYLSPAERRRVARRLVWIRALVAVQRALALEALATETGVAKDREPGPESVHLGATLEEGC